MHLIDCPWCGKRDQAEFHYRGDASVRRPGGDEGPDAFFAYTYLRTNPMGWHLEWWHHAGGCRQWIKVLRNTLTHAIAATGKPADHLEAPPQ